MTEECLFWRLITNVPQFACFIHRSGDIRLFVRRQWNRHHITAMRIKFNRFLAHLQIPLAYFHVTRSGDDVSVVQKTTWAQKTCINETQWNTVEWVQDDEIRCWSGNLRSRLIHEQFSLHQSNRDCSNRTRCTCYPFHRKLFMNRMEWNGILVR